MEDVPPVSERRQQTRRANRLTGSALCISFHTQREKLFIRMLVWLCRLAGSSAAISEVLRGTDSLSWTVLLSAASISAASISAFRGIPAEFFPAD